MEFLESGGMYFRGNFKRKEKNNKGKEKEKGKKIKEGGGCQPFPNKSYGVQRSRTSSRKGVTRGPVKLWLQKWDREEINRGRKKGK